MSRGKCPRLWEAEAIEDARLGAAARASFERHVAACGECADLRAAFARLRALGEAVDAATSTPLERRRLRAAILRAGNDQVLRPSRAPRKPTAMLGAAAIAIGIAVAHHYTTKPPSPRPSADVSFEIAPIDAAEWHVDRQGAETLVSLRNGTLSIRVAKLDPGQRFLLALPDANLEVHGTQFRVRVDGGRTSGVDVLEGVVTLAWRSGANQSLTAGQRWSAPTIAEVDADGAAGIGVAPVPEEHPPPSDAMKPRHPLAERRAARHESPGESNDDSSTIRPRTGEPAETPGMVFAGAMAAFSSGSYASADALLVHFCEQFATDARCEDADFVRIVIRKRSGDEAGARRMASEYLHRHPGGFRRNEVAHILE